MLRKNQIADERIFTGIDLYRKGFVAPTGIEMYFSEYYQYEASLTKFNAYLSNGWHIPHLDLFITEKCTLKCKDCCSLVPYMKNPTHCNAEEVFTAFDNLLRSGAYVSLVNLIGGEPFLNQKFMREFLERYKDNPSIGAFYTISNGTVVPEQVTLDAMKSVGKKRFYVFFSNYGVLSTKLNEAVKALVDNDIVCMIYQNEDPSAPNYTTWLSYGEPVLQKKSDEEYQAMFEDCQDVHWCQIILHGKLYICGRIAYMNDMGLIPEESKNYLDLTSKEALNMAKDELKKECCNLLYPKHYPPGCKYCKRGEYIEIQRAEQL